MDSDPVILDEYRPSPGHPITYWDENKVPHDVESLTRDATGLMTMVLRNGQTIRFRDPRIQNLQVRTVGAEQVVEFDLAEDS